MHQNNENSQSDKRKLISEEYKERKNNIRRLHNQYFAEQLLQAKQK